MDSHVLNQRANVGTHRELGGVDRERTTQLHTGERQRVWHHTQYNGTTSGRSHMGSLFNVTPIATPSNGVLAHVGVRAEATRQRPRAALYV